MLTKSLTDAGFVHYGADGKAVKNADYSGSFFGLNSENRKAEFKSGEKTVVLELVGGGPTPARHITFFNGKDVVLHSTSGDVPNDDFISSFIKLIENGKGK